MNKIKQINCYINLPEMRDELVSWLSDLSSKEYQKKNWLSDQYKHSFWDNVLNCIDTLFDLLDLNSIPEDQLDYTLRSSQELDLIKPLTQAIDTICDILGPDQKDEIYWHSPLWDEVVEAAQKAYEVFKHNDEICENIIKEDIKDSNYQIHDLEIRQKLIETFRDLSNQNHQKYQWIIDQSPTSFWHQISASMIYLLQELNFKETPQDQLKAFIRSKKECEVIDCVIHALEEVETHIGPNKEWDAYWNSPLWDQVVEAALYAYNVLICNDEFCRKMNERKA